jgi:hypothetical protein
MYISFKINMVVQVDVYLSLLVLIHLLDKNKGEEALQCANMLMAKIDSHNR